MPLTPEMKFEIVPFKDGYRVVSSDGAFFSNHPLSAKMARRQQKALYAKAKQGHIYSGGSFTYMYHQGQPHLILKGSGFLGDFFAKVKQVANNVVKKVTGFVQPVVQRVSDVSQGIRNDYPPAARQVLAQYGDAQVKSILVRREPIQSMINKALNVITLGQWNKARGEMPYDSLFHLSMVATVETPMGMTVPIVVEKNEVINISTDYKSSGKMEFVNIPVIQPITFKEMMDRAQERAGAEFFKYQAFTNNCQMFIDNILDANGLNTPQIKAFVLQDVDTLLKKLPSYVSPLSTIATNIAGLANVVRFGRGKKKLRGGIDYKYVARKFLATSAAGNTLYTLLILLQNQGIPDVAIPIIAIVSAIIAGVSADKITKELIRRYDIDPELQDEFEDAIDEVAEAPALHQVVVDEMREQEQTEAERQQPARAPEHIAIDIVPEIPAERPVERAAERAPDREVDRAYGRDVRVVRNPLREIPRDAVAVAVGAPRREEVGIEMPPAGAVYVNPLHKGRGKKRGGMLPYKKGSVKKAVDTPVRVGSKAKVLAAAKEPIEVDVEVKEALAPVGSETRKVVLGKKLAFGKGKKEIVMKPKDFFSEHKKLVGMLSSVGSKLTKEAKEQASEAKGWKKKLTRGGIVLKGRKCDCKGLSVCGGAVDKATYLKRQASGFYPKDLSYEDFVAQETGERKRIDTEVQALKQSNKEYEDFVKQNPEYESTVCKIGEDLEPAKGRDVVPKAVCDERHRQRNKKIDEATPFGKIMKGITTVGDTIMSVAPVPAPLKEAWSVGKQLAGVGKGRSKEPMSKFKGQLESAGLSPQLYLRRVRASAKKAGYNPKNVVFADDNKHKLMITTDDGKVVKFGSVGNGDLILHSHKSKEEGLKAQKAYLARATKIKGNWKDDKFSPNSLAISLIWNGDNTI